MNRRKTMKEKEMMKGFDGIQTIHKSNETFQFKVIVKRIVVGLLLATMLVGVFSLVGCTQNIPSTDTQSGIADTNSDVVIDTDLGTDLDTNLDTNLDTDLGQPPLDTDDPVVDPDNPGNQDNPDVNPDNPVINPDDPTVDPSDPPAETPPEENTTFDEFMKEHGTLANQFALDQIEQIPYNDKALSTSYAYVSNGDAVEKIVVAQVVAKEGTARELKIATINFTNPVDFDDIVAGEDNSIPVITSQTALSFDAKEEYKKGDTSTIAQDIADEIEQNLGEDVVEIDEYERETFAPTTVADLAADYATAVNSTFNSRFLTEALKLSRFLSLDASLVHDAKWILNGDKQVESIDFAFHYGEGDSQAYYVVNLALSNPLTIDDVIKNADSLADVTTTKTQKYYIDYTQSVQGTRDELMNAIFKANGMSAECPSGATRLIVDVSDGMGVTISGEIHKFRVCEIREDGISEFTINIKKSNNDSEYITKLSGRSNYEILEEKSANLAGEDVEYHSSSLTSASTMPASTTTNGKENRFI